ncbi:MAG TPA: hypothetical protein VHS99_04400 [Chloroflexota bacterium]|nr:hypothetical protein [Chloroflexota bacterium]
MLPAMLWTAALWGRTSLGGLSWRWLATLLAATLAAAAWTLYSGRRQPLGATLGLLPAALVSAAVLLPLYLSEELNHRFVHDPALKGLVLPLSGLLVLAAPLWGEAGAAWLRAPAQRRLGAAWDAAREYLARHQRLVVAGTLGSAGVLQALSYTNVATDDLIRYWSIADAILGGAGYPVTEGVPGSGEFYLIDQPFYPLLIAGSFALLGHRYLALHLPLILANVALPFVFYALARATGMGRHGALWLALVLLCFPFYQVYSLGAAEPEPLWTVEAGLMLLAAMRLTRPRFARSSQSRVPGYELTANSEPGTRNPELLWWLLLGLSAAAAALTRPEGVLYAGLTMLGLAWWLRGTLWRGLHDVLGARRPRPEAIGYVLAGVLCAVPVGLYSLFLWRQFGVVSGAGWLGIAGLEYLIPNLTIILRQDLPHYAAVGGLPYPAQSGVILAALLVAGVLVGLWRLVRRRPALAFVPLPLAINLAVILLTPTDFAGDVLSPQTFLRHLSVLFPWLVPALALSVPWRYAGLAGAWSWVARVALGAVLVWELAVLGAATSQVQRGGPTVLTSDPYVLITDLWQASDTLPWLPFGLREGRVVAIDAQFDYLAFRHRLFDAVRPYDQHANDAGRAYVLATAVVALTGLLLVPPIAPAPRPQRDPPADSRGR